MEFIQIVYILAAIVGFGYMAGIKIKFPKLASLSDSYYQLGTKGFWFQVWAIVTAFLLFIPWVDISPENIEFISYLSVCALMCVGCAPLFKTTQFWQHTLSAVLCVGLSVLWNGLYGTLLLSACSLLSLLVMYGWNKIFNDDYELAEDATALDTLMYNLKMNDVVYWIEFGFITTTFTVVGLQVF